ncbi:hypothetical protein QEZ54_09420 [Catellatospora sp. KI3]|uniref:hypothetical protein n=1 Tax=Catellatospora sp. KI3 TaxID=3041620 RepID=UPI00248220F5|nr:hypothetical protein [Catellatospora sp. KI3]MDI1461184.1 hypothetical protein [Catellatospora sp. KI3]
MNLRSGPVNPVDRRALTLGLSAVLLVAALGGCGTAAPAGVAPPAAAGAPAPTWAAAPSPAAQDLVTWSGTFPQHRYLVTLAENELTRRCMSDRGFAWSGYTPDQPTGATDEQRLLDLDRRRREGYGMAAGGDDAEPATAADPAESTPAYRLALFGDEKRTGSVEVPGLGTITYALDGCIAQGYAGVFGDLDSWARVAYLPQGLNRTAARQAAADPRYTAALDGWRRCMAAHGHAYQTPDAIRVALGTAYEQSTEPAETRLRTEIALAVQDGQCDVQAGLSRTELRLRRESVLALDTAQRAEVADLAVRFAAAVGRAHALLGR